MGTRSTVVSTGYYALSHTFDIYQVNLSNLPGTFQRLLPIAPSKSMRLICINRREYPGTTPFSDDEKRVIVSGSDEERYTFFQKQGISLAKFVCRLIDQCAIPAPTLSKERVGSKEIKKGGITVGAWSLGNVYMISIVACIDVVDKEVRNQLQVYVTGFLLWGAWCT